MLTDYEDRIVEALKKDLNRHPWETHTADILGLKQDILHTIGHFRDWVKDGSPAEAQSAGWAMPLFAKSL
jgi:hypothetical protein